MAFRVQGRQVRRDQFTAPTPPPGGLYDRQARAAAAKSSSRQQKIFRVGVALVVVMAVVAAAPMVAGLARSQRLDAIVKSLSTRVFAGSATLNSTQIETGVRSIIAANPKLTIGVSVIDLDSGQKVNVGTTAPFDAASTTKVLTAAAFMRSVERDNDSLGETLGGYDAKYQLQEMINQSDNDSWALLSSQVGLPQLQNYANSIGLTSCRVNGNTITSADEAKLLAELYRGKLLNPADTNLVLGFMQNTNNEDMIPAALPAGTTVYHKYGELNGDLHDAGIIISGQHHYVLVIYTNGQDDSDYTVRVNMIKQITKTVVSAAT